MSKEPLKALPKRRCLEVQTPHQVFGCLGFHQNLNGTEYQRIPKSLSCDPAIWVFPKIGVPPTWMVNIMENPIKMGWFGGTKPLFLDTPISSSVGPTVSSVGPTVCWRFLKNSVGWYTPGSSNIAGWKMGAPKWVDVFPIKNVGYSRQLC